MDGEDAARPAQAPATENDERSLPRQSAGAGVPWARIGEHVGQRNLAVTANTYSHVLADEAELDTPDCSTLSSTGGRHTVVYSDTMGRTQIYLGSDELELLDRVARATGASRSELVRRAVRSTFGQPTKADKLQALEASAGSWRGRSFTGSEYVDSVRGDLDERLSRLGLE
jgi:hypothetical protein